MEEIWRAVEGFDGKYEVSDMGRVRTLTRRVRCGGGFRINYGRILKTIVVYRKNVVYRSITLWDSVNRPKTFLVHKLVAKAFIDNPENMPCVDHIYGSEIGDAVWNLRWCTQKENMRFELARKHCSESKRGEKNPRYGKFGADNPCSKVVLQLSLKGNLIQKYDSATEASNRTGVNLGHLAACCRGEQKTAGGYIWKYVDKNE